MEQLFSGDLVAVNLIYWRVPREGWSLRLRRTYEYSAPGAHQEELYDRLSRAELLDVLDAIRAQLDIPGPEW